MQVPRIAISNRMVDGWTLAILIQLSKALNLAKITQLCDLNITHIGNTYLHLLKKSQKRKTRSFFDNWLNLNYIPNRGRSPFWLRECVLGQPRTFFTLEISIQTAPDDCSYLIHTQTNDYERDSKSRLQNPRHESYKSMLNDLLWYFSTFF